MPNPLAHFELSSNDLDNAKVFYTKLFDWKLEDVPGSYTMISPGKGIGGGMMPNPLPNTPSFWLTYIEVSDIVASTKKVADLGGTVMKDVTEVMGMGRISVVLDPSGAAFGLWQPNAA